MVCRLEEEKRMEEANDASERLVSRFVAGAAKFQEPKQMVLGFCSKSAWHPSKHRLHEPIHRDDNR